MQPQRGDDSGRGYVWSSRLNVRPCFRYTDFEVIDGVSAGGFAFRPAEVHVECL